MFLSRASNWFALTTAPTEKPQNPHSASELPRAVRRAHVFGKICFVSSDWSIVAQQPISVPALKFTELSQRISPDQHLSPYSGCRAWKQKQFIKIQFHWELRVFVVWCSNGVHLKGFCLYFSSTIKYMTKTRFFIAKIVSNISSLQTKIFAFSTCPNRRLLKIRAHSPT